MPRKPAVKPEDVDYKMHFGIWIDPGLDPGDFCPYLTMIYGTLDRMLWDPATGKFDTKEIGQLEAFRFEVGRAMDDGVGIVHEVDYANGDALHYCETLYQEDANDYRPEIEEAYEHNLFGWDSLAVHTMKIDKEYRGRNLGLHFLHWCMRLFGTSCGLTIIKPFPLDYSRHDPKEVTARKEKKLQRYWSKLGFERIPGCGYYVFPMCLRMKEPPKLKSVEPPG